MAGAGIFRDRCDIQADNSADGNPVPDYTTYAALYDSVPCDVTTISGSETFRGRQLEAGLSHVVELQYLPDILPTMRLSITGGTLSGRTLNIAAVVPLDYDGRKRKLQLLCREVPTV